MNKKKKSTNTSPYPDEVIDRLARAFYPAILACWNSEEGQREFAAWQAEKAHHIPSKEKQSVPDGERSAVHIAIACGFFRVRPIRGRTLFLFCTRLYSAHHQSPSDRRRKAADRIGLLLKKLFGEASHSESILRIETNRFASANLEYKLVMVDDDLNIVALPETRNIKSIVTAEDRLCIERKNKQAVQGLLYVRFICFGNGNLVAAHDDSDGFWRRQILVAVKDRDPARIDNPFLIEELSEERPGILLWMLEGLHRLLANRYQFTISERSRRNLEAAMEDGDNLSQFMQAQAYVRFRPDSEERSTYLYRAYTKWCEDNLESPVTQKKFSQFLLKNSGRYGLTFTKHIEGKYRGFRGVCVRPAFAA